jgi:hypothetical protein
MLGPAGIARRCAAALVCAALGGCSLLSSPATRSPGSGPGQRYTLAMMNSLNGHGGYHAGTNTVTQVAAILFRGHQVQAPQVSATP